MNKTFNTFLKFLFLAVTAVTSVYIGFYLVLEQEFETIKKSLEASEKNFKNRFEQLIKREPRNELEKK
jgi:hypothetical protein